MSMEFRRECNPSGLNILDLPPEIRISIYEFCLKQPGWTVIDNILPLCHSNQQIRYETLPLFYRANDIHLDLRAARCTLQTRLERWQKWLATSCPKSRCAIRSFDLSLNVSLVDGVAGVPASRTQNKSSVTAEMHIAARWFAIRFMGPYELSQSSWQFLDATMKDLLAMSTEETWDGNTLLLIADMIVQATPRLECVPPWPVSGRLPKRFAYERNASTGEVQGRHCWSSYEWESHSPNGGCVCPDRTR